MKNLIIIVLLALGMNIAMSDIAPDAMKPFIDQCKSEYKITDDDLIMRNHSLTGEKKCFHFCVAKRVGYMDKDGNIQIEHFKNNLGKFMPKELMESVEKCTVEATKGDPCDVAQQICKCMHEA